MVDVIQKKRDGGALSKEEILFAVSGYTSGDVPDYQMAAFAMAVYFQGMSAEETSYLTEAMAHSGDMIDLSAIQGVKTDKHSTGGVGDKTSLIVVPLVAAMGIPVAKMSGRGLGHTGGTVDKLESIPGFQIELTKEQFIANVNHNKMALAGQSGNLAPADKKLYALRDVTATVNSIPLIASSIMSKKIASGADAIVLDVKVGSGAFMKSLEEAEQLARTMTEIGNRLGRRTIAVLSNMNEPLGLEVGNANEVKEAVQVLRGTGDARLTELCLVLAANMTLAAGKYSTYDEAYKEADAALRSGQALQTFKTFVEAQGGNPAVADDLALLPQAAFQIPVVSEEEGYVEAMNAEGIGMAAMVLGAGRKTKEDTIDYGAGITLHKKIGDQVQRGEPLATILSNKQDIQEAAMRIRESYKLSAERPAEAPLIYKIIQ